MSRIILFILLALYSIHVQCKICPTTKVLNSITNLRKLENCSQIAGNLLIVLLEQTKSESEFDGYVFPDLIAISGYLMFFKVKHLTSIGQLFPNLHLIRGQTLVRDYSFVISDMPHLLQIGTTNLLSIERGAVRIQRSSDQLCFVNTVNWVALGADHLVYYRNRTAESTCKRCPDRCKGSCWDSDHCMETKRDCHKECLGCTEKNSPKHCILCRNVRNNGECVSRCPTDKYDLQLLHECVTKEGCENFNVTSEPTVYFTYDNGTDRKCINECPSFYSKSETIVGEKVIRTCIYCGDECVKKCSTDPVETEDEIKKLSGCTHIDGPLIIRNLKTSKTNQLFNEHLAAIRYISGTLKISRTKLSSLDFLRRVTYIGLNDTEVPKSIYSIVIYENPYLQNLWTFNKTLKIKGKYSFHDNALLCLSEIKKLRYTTNVSYNSPIDVSENSNGEQATCATHNLTDQINVTVSSTNATIVWNPPKLGEDESYISFTVYYKEDKGKNATFSNSTVCEDGDWNKVYVTASNDTIIAFLDNLLPFSAYAYYIKSYISKGNYRQGSQSDMMHFKTLPDDPDGFTFFRLTPIDYQSINLNWTKPKSPNGILAEYRLYYKEIEEAYSFERDYCRYPRKEESGDHIDYDEKDDYNGLFGGDLNKTTLPNSDSVCNCSESKLDEAEEIKIISKGAKSQLCIDMANSPNDMKECMKFEYQAEKREKRSYGEPVFNDTVTSLNFTKLKPFRLYVFYLSACNHPKEQNHCSGVLQRFARTKKNPDADKIDGLRVELLDETSVKISWIPPKSPNTPIVAYRINISSENSKNSEPLPYCIPILNSTDERIYKNFTDLTPGTHIVTVYGESLAGVSTGTPEKFDIPYPPSRHAPLIAIVVTGLILIIAALTAYLLFRSRRMKRIPLIRTVNPDYEGAVYVPDHWEIDISDVKFVKELGRGNFGTVFQGLIKSLNLPCAVKVVNESLNVYQRMEFLIEASVMKSFNDCYHVVKLLGVVSRHQPPLVIMELMERGDLKNYLRKTRDSSHNLTSSEIYRMAVEIADGMAYLSAKKFVHRDLAARNCMVASDRTVKVGDFGMARDIYTTDYYRKASKGLLPVRWMAPESLADGVFTTDSDVWSYGIVLWEIATLAEQPYQGLSNEHVRQFIISRGRLTRPPECSDLLYDVMKQCWSWRPTDRPSFWDIIERLEDRVSEEFKLVAFVHSREASLCSRQRAEHPAALSIAPRDELLCHYNVSDEDISLHVGGVPRRPSYLQASISHRRFSPPDDIY